MINQTNVEYRGNVEVKLRIKDRVFSFHSHNEGLPALQESFARIMSGNYRGIYDIPQFIEVRRSTSGEGEPEEYVSFMTVNRVPITGANWFVDENNECIARFTANITSEMLYESVSADSTDKFMLYLFTISEDHRMKRDLARLAIPASQLAKIVPGVSAVIEWSMKLVNSVE